MLIESFIRLKEMIIKRNYKSWKIPIQHYLKNLLHKIKQKYYN